jgi:hypothetical protein
VFQGHQHWARITTDLAGGAIIVWADLRDAFQAIYAQRVNAAGIPQWAANGVVIHSDQDTDPDTTITNGSSAYEPQIISDTLGGAIVVWRDGDINTTLFDFTRNGPAVGAVGWFCRWRCAPKLSQFDH